jgi:hypothetical protein
MPVHKKTQRYCGIYTSVGNQIKVKEMGRSYGTYGGGDKIYTGFWWQNKEERDHLEGKDVDRRIILKLTVKYSRTLNCEHNPF